MCQVKIPNWRRQVWASSSIIVVFGSNTMCIRAFWGCFENLTPLYCTRVLLRKKVKSTKIFEYLIPLQVRFVGSGIWVPRIDYTSPWWVFEASMWIWILFPKVSSQNKSQLILKTWVKKCITFFFFHPLHPPMPLKSLSALRIGGILMPLRGMTACWTVENSLCIKHVQHRK